MFSYIMDKDDHDASNLSPSTNSFTLSTNTSPPSTPSALANEEGVEEGSHLYRARLIVENHLYDQLLTRYRLAVKRLHELTIEANTLQEENEWLRSANEDLARHAKSLLSTGAIASDRNIGSGDRNEFGNNNNGIMGSNSPTSVMVDNNGGYNHDEERFTLPKSISVRSPGYFKAVTPPSRSPVPPQRVNGTKLRVRKEEKAVEMEVFNQGMYKTELCNKWQETSTCPYGDQCRFAHGVSELRPVIRHPRYKTQVCRMILAGGSCPYGHRCHFRHSLQ